MVAINTIHFVLILFSFVALHVQANDGSEITNLDAYWQARAKEAKIQNKLAYNPSPESVTADFNANVEEALEDYRNSTRRNLRDFKKNYKGPCDARNPIDRCWRCDPDWINNRKRLADCALGFANGTTGGKEGKFYVVNDASDEDLEDPKPGTLRHAVTRNEPLWIIFDRSMIIRLQEELMMTGDKTIDGRGFNVHIAYGAGITVNFIKNVIIHNLHIHDIIPAAGGNIRDKEDHVDIRTKSDGDGINVYGSSMIWMDHLSMYNCFDGLIDVIFGSTAITISNCHFTHHNEAILLGSSDQYSDDKILQVTIAFNRFGKGLVQRMPRCRWGFFHIVNNEYTGWGMYAIGGSSNPTILSQGNRFTAPRNTASKEVTKREHASEEEWMKWQWRSEGDVLLNGAFFKESGPGLTEKSMVKEGMIKYQPGQFAPQLVRFAGTLHCHVGKPC